jgi:hypothetical protein
VGEELRNRLETWVRQAPFDKDAAVLRDIVRLGLSDRLDEGIDVQAFELMVEVLWTEVNPGLRAIAARGLCQLLLHPTVGVNDDERATAAEALTARLELEDDVNVRVAITEALRG